MPEEKAQPDILIVDDDTEIRYSLDRVLASRGYKISTAGSGEDGIKVLKELDPDVVFLDIRMDGMSGLEALQHMRAANKRVPIILMTAFGTAQTAIEAMKYGAFDYIMKPFDPDRVLALVQNALKAAEDLRRAADYQSTLRSDDWKEGIVGSSPAMQEVFKIIGQFAASDATVMITGESGTGKELIARCLVQHSLRSNREFVAVNCAAIPENLIESELFGHEKGSFTGALAQRIGRFEQCDGGTIFLDEIGDMDLPTQTKILRVLQEGEIQRVGGGQTIQVDVRVIAATNKDLEKLVKEKAFREDLYYRLNVVRIRVPPLRDRASDIPEIVEFMLQTLEKERKSKVRRVSPEVMEILCQHNWPGNVRELENVVYRSAVVARGDAILIKDLPPEMLDGADSTAAPSSGEPEQALFSESEAVAQEMRSGGESTLPISELLDRVFAELSNSQPGGLLKAVEAEMVKRALEQAGGDQAAAAKVLGITRNLLKKRAEDLAL